MKTKGLTLAKFSWQNGYGAFSIAEDQLGALKNYIGNQVEHHARITFEEEFLELLRRYCITYDEQYVWD